MLYPVVAPSPSLGVGLASWSGGSPGLPDSSLLPFSFPNQILAHLILPGVCILEDRV